MEEKLSNGKNNAIWAKCQNHGQKFKIMLYLYSLFSIKRFCGYKQLTNIKIHILNYEIRNKLMSLYINLGIYN